MPHPTDAAVKAATTADLLDEQAVLEGIQRDAKAKLEVVRAELITRTAKDLDAALEVAKKQGGTIDFLFGNMELTASIDKEVKWDSAKLMAVIGQLPWASAQQIFKMEFSIPERTYAVLPAAMSVSEEQAALLKQIDAARSVKYGKPKITARA